MHAQMLMILMVTVLVAQVVLVEWRKRHFRSYQVGLNGSNNISIFMNIRPLSGCNFVCNVDRAPRPVYTQLLVEVHLLLVVVFNHFSPSPKESIGKASPRFHASISLQMVLLSASSQLRSGYRRLQYNNVHIHGNL